MAVISHTLAEEKELTFSNTLKRPVFNGAHLKNMEKQPTKSSGNKPSNRNFRLFENSARKCE